MLCQKPANHADQKGNKKMATSKPNQGIPPSEPPEPFIGRPRKFRTPEEMQVLIDRYFDQDAEVIERWNNGVKYQQRCPTISGLAIYLGFCDRHSMYAYEKFPEFSHTIKRARERITQQYENLIQAGVGAGPIFMLKNLGYKDKTEVDMNAKVVKMDKIVRDGKEVDFDFGITEAPRSPGEDSPGD